MKLSSVWVSYYLFACETSSTNFDRDQNTVVSYKIPEDFCMYLFCSQFSLKLTKCLINVHILTPHDLSANSCRLPSQSFDFCSLAGMTSLLSNTVGFGYFFAFLFFFYPGLCLPPETALHSISESHCRVLGLLISFVLTVLCTDPGFLSLCT